MVRHEFCTVEDEGHVRIVTINRPEVLNALHSPANHELEQVWNEFAETPDLWVGIITGAGDRAFSAGNDLKVTAAGKRGPRPPSGVAGLTHRFDLNKPVIAAVNGLAMGGGFEIALACDIIVADERAFFALSEVRVGMTAAAGGLHRLARMIPQKQAMGLILTGSRVPAQRGLELGFVNEIAPAGQSLDVARRWASTILECSPMAVRASKEAILRGFDETSLETAIRTTYPAQKANAESPNYVEGARAFAEKRKPAWTNS